MADGRWKFVALLVLIFLLGVATGGFGHRYLESKGYFRHATRPSPRQNRGEIIERFTKELGLTADQQQQLNAILAEQEQRFKDLNKSFRTQADTIHQEGRNKIRAILTDQQKPKFEEMLKRFDEERHQREERRK